MSQPIGHMKDCNNPKCRGNCQQHLLTCPHCKGEAILKLEGKHYTKRYGKKAQYGRIVCSNNNPFHLLKNKRRCLAKTVAAPVNEVIKHWNMRT